MSKYIKWVWIAVVVLALFSFGTLIADMHALQSNLVRFHVVASSNSAEDQQMKLLVRDAIIAHLQKNVKGITDIQEAKKYIRSQLPELETVANHTLKKFGSDHKARVRLVTEEFGAREYDTFRLPSGIYSSLKIEIGNAEGENWWCVVFPSLCLPVTADAFVDTAVSAGLDKGLVYTLLEHQGYKVRFFFLDCLGKIENLFNFS